jgi:RecB family endonuclease NucS
LVVELKAGKADYKVFGQISMYIGPLMKKYPEKSISGIIVAGEIDESLKMAISAYKNVRTMTYKMKLTLEEIM